LSPAEIAAALGEPVGAVAYHVRRLEDAGLVEFVEQRRDRGSTEHFFTAPHGLTISDEEWRTLSILERRAVIAGGLGRLGPSLGLATARDGFARAGAHVEVVRVQINADRWHAAASEFATALDEIERAGDEAKFRAYEAGVAVRPGAAVLMLFMPPPRSSSEVRGGLRRTPVDLADSRVANAISHPLRAEIFRLLLDREASPSGMSKILDAPIANTSYHVHQLVKLGLVELTHRRDRGGAIEHYYAASVTPTILHDEWHVRIADTNAARATGLLVSAAREGGFDADGIHSTRTSFLADDEAWERVEAALRSARARLSALGSAGDLTNDTGTPRAAACGITMLFEPGHASPASNPAAASGSPS
jgi:DNA-binding transcriptional ArsR family regulator